MPWGDSMQWCGEMSIHELLCTEQKQGTWCCYLSADWYGQSIKLSTYLNFFCFLPFFAYLFLVFVLVYLSIYLFIYLSIYLSTYLPVRLQICVSVYLWVSLSVCLRVYESRCLMVPRKILKVIINEKKPFDSFIVIIFKFENLSFSYLFVSLSSNLWICFIIS